MNHRRALALLLVAAVVPLMMSATSASVPAVRRLPASATPTSPSEIVLAAGDIASCTSTGDEVTAAMLDGQPGTVVTLGDNVYDSGTTAEFSSCYDPGWGRHKARTHPAVGNHEYGTPGAAGYFGYFGAAAGDPAKGYYSFDLGAWHLIALNSNCDAIGGCAAGSPQETWLRADLKAHPASCTLAYWHHPRFSSGPHGSDPLTQDLWQALYDFHTDVVLTGHDHDYERFAPQKADGTLDAALGIREFVVGTGGRSHYAIGTRAPNSEAANGSTYGLLKLTLSAGSYDWSFLPEPGKTFTDAGAGSCHGSPVDADADTVPDYADNCPGVANPDQHNSDGAIDNGIGAPAPDTTAPAADALGDACDPDDDNDGLPDADETASGACGPYDLSATAHPHPARDDDSNDDNRDGEAAPLMGTDAADDGPAWDTDGDAVRDGYECARGSDPRDAASRPGALPGDVNDDDGDGLTNGTERRFWGTDPSLEDSDGDGTGDCTEALDIDGNGVLNFPGDTILAARAASRLAGRAWEFDLDANGVLNFPGDVIAYASRTAGAIPCL